MLLCRILRRCEEVPFEGESMREEGLGRGNVDNLLGGWVSQRASVKMDLVRACDREKEVVLA